MKNTSQPARETKSIFACDWCLREVITKWQKYLKAKLPCDNGEYYCFYKEGWDDDESNWHFTEKFRVKMGIDLDFIQMLNEALDYPNHEDDIVNKFTVEQAIQKIRQYREIAENESR